MRCRAWMLVGLMLAGCASRQTGGVRDATAAPATRPVAPSLLALEQIDSLPTTLPAPATQPTLRPPLDALELYAQARGMQLEGDRAGAAGALEKALEKDPDSFDLNHSLGQIYAALGNSDSAIKAMERAAALRPDDLDVHVQLGRLYLSRDKPAEAIRHLRLAMLTSDYALPEYAVVVDYLLARGLQQKGYDAAAIEMYARLIACLGQRLHVRFNPELYVLISRPESVYLQAGQLCEKCGRYEQSLQYYLKAAERDPDSFDIQSHIVHARLGLKQIDKAQKQAMELVIAHHASGSSLELLKTVYGQTDGRRAVIDALRKLLKRQPEERAILFALADALTAQGNAAEAEKLLADAVAKSPNESALVSRLCDFQLNHGDTQAAARAVIEYLARNPEGLRQIGPLWGRLVRSSTRHYLRLPEAQGLTVPPEAAAAKSFLISRMAEALGRDTLARASLEQAVQSTPPFAPAYRELLALRLQREDWDQKQKTQSAEALIQQAGQRRQPALADELRGMLCMYLKDFSGAVAAFDQAVRDGAHSPEVQYALASALYAQGKQSQGEQSLWKLIGDWPTFDDAYATLFQRYLDKSSAQQALRVLQAWLSADPLSINARLLQADVAMQTDRMELADSLLTRLFQEEPENTAVLAMLNRWCVKAGKSGDFAKRLEEQWNRDRGNRVIANTLVQIYVGQKRLDDALRIADGMRAAVADDVDQLYFSAHLYELAGQHNMTEAALLQALKLDPAYGPANNDLGYMWADEGKDLDRAEALIRLAVQSDPENAAYLDSLGWVLYKRSKFDEARRYLEQATQTGRPDPVVLDHLADALYRLGRRDEAVQTWRNSMKRLDETTSDREDLKKLRQELKRKIRQHENGEAVSVAPVM